MIFEVLDLGWSLVKVGHGAWGMGHWALLIVIYEKLLLTIIHYLLTTNNYQLNNYQLV
ncbi:hypothetical protein [[Scytonema hofmanni] UTEX B 1581]|uniref:hypothetical protein n=1 Tax=[Scytonema hofmanni] UTEX B 1581 TaxID=379535 RepID=UPI0004B6A89E|nr:hypothetical protein [[Scytonema hofmanni] UTEX B 1581]